MYSNMKDFPYHKINRDPIINIPWAWMPNDQRSQKDISSTDTVSGTLLANNDIIVECIGNNF